MSQFYKGQQVKCGESIGVVLRMFGNKAVQVSTKRTKVQFDGFPAKPVGEITAYVKETWPVSGVQPWTTTTTI